MTTATLAPTGIDAVFFLVRDFKRGRDFYENALGLTPTQEFIGDSGSFVEYDLGDGNTFGIGLLPDREWHVSGGIMFAVSDVVATLERLRSSGAKVLDEPFESPACTMAWVQDPDGNYFCLHKRKI